MIQYAFVYPFLLILFGLLTIQNTRRLALVRTQQVNVFASIFSMF